MIIVECIAWKWAGSMTFLEARNLFCSASFKGIMPPRLSWKRKLGFAEIERSSFLRWIEVQVRDGVCQFCDKDAGLDTISSDRYDFFQIFSFGSFWECVLQVIALFRTIASMKKGGREIGCKEFKQITKPFFIQVRGANTEEVYTKQNGQQLNHMGSRRRRKWVWRGVDV